VGRVWRSVLLSLGGQTEGQKVANRHGVGAGLQGTLLAEEACLILEELIGLLLLHSF
jgi:hypothetical protein